MKIVAYMRSVFARMRASRADRHPAFGLALRLAVPLSCAVIAAMAAVSGIQLVIDLRAEFTARRELVGRSVSPLVDQLRRLPSDLAVRSAIGEFHDAMGRQGHARHLLQLLNPDGAALVTYGDLSVLQDRDAISLAVPFRTDGIGPRALTLVVTDIDPAGGAERRRRWQAWIVHTAVTGGVLFALMYLIIKHQIAEPISRLVDAVRQMQMGYWNEAADPGGAWELRWLGSRFSAFGKELSRSVHHLVLAQRRAYEATCVLDSGAQPRPTIVQSTAAADGLDSDPAFRPLTQALTELRLIDPSDPRAREFARRAWDELASRAEELGHVELRGELEDAALPLLDPEGWARLAYSLQAERPRLEALAKAHSERIGSYLATRGIPLVSRHQRVKHVAGVWKKMQHKGLTLRQVHDLVAVRIVLPTEDDCYRALGALQDFYTPVVGRFKDYIAEPKPNGYRSIHVTVSDEQGQMFEVQLRSVAMHVHAERGPAAHVFYKQDAA